MSRFCIIILARANHFFPLEKGFHQLFMGLEKNMRARSKGKNHQDNYTKTTSLKFAFTQIAVTNTVKNAFSRALHGLVKRSRKFYAGGSGHIPADACGRKARK